MARSYTVEFMVTVELFVNDDNVIERIYEDAFKNDIYNLAEADAVEMLARNCAIEMRNLTSLDGWADCNENDVLITSVEFALEDWWKDGVRQ